MERLAALSDGVLAAIRTLLVLDLRAPEVKEIHNEHDVWVDGSGRARAAPHHVRHDVHHPRRRRFPPCCWPGSSRAGSRCCCNWVSLLLHSGEGGCCAWAVGHGIDAISVHFEDGLAHPRLVQLHYIRDESIRLEPHQIAVRSRRAATSGGAEVGFSRREAVAPL